MSNRLVSLFIRCAVICFAIAESLICFFWYPFSITLSTVGLFGKVTSEMQLVEMWTQLIFYLATALPCYVVFVIFWTISTLIKSDKAFSPSTVKRLKICTILLAVDLAVFLAGNILFLCLGWNDFAFIYFVCTGIGVIAIGVLAVISQYAKKAVLLKEENDSYL